VASCLPRCPCITHPAVVSQGKYSERSIEARKENRPRPP
jgi:hypothetical protein